MPSTLQEISWSPSPRRMGLDFVPPLSTCVPPSFKSLIKMTQSPSASALPWASLTTRAVSDVAGGASRGHSWPQVTHSHLFGNSNTSVISHIGQAGLLIKRQDGRFSRRETSAYADTVKCKNEMNCVTKQCC